MTHNKYTPMLRQYLTIKEQHPDKILFFRLGDFYEMFFSDAEKASEILSIVLTARNAGDGNKVPMCGIPYHSADSYIQRLIEAGEKVAICEQMEDPQFAQGLVNREVVRIITPGTWIDENYLEPGENLFLVSIHNFEDIWSYAYLDISTGLFKYGQYSGNTSLEALKDKLARLNPAEIIIDDEHLDVEKLLRSRAIRNVIERIEFNIEDSPVNLSGLSQTDKKAVLLLLDYIYRNQKDLLARLYSLEEDDENKFMILDSSTIRNLELLLVLRDQKKYGSLYHYLDRSRTGMGSRLLKDWIVRPLIDKKDILSRQDAVAYLLANNSLLQNLAMELKGIPDIERLSARLANRSLNAQDLLRMESGLAKAASIAEKFPHDTPKLLLNLIPGLLESRAISEFLKQSINPEAPVSVKEGDLIRDGFHEEIDRLRQLTRKGSIWISELELREKERTGIKNLKVGYNKVFGYYLEVSKSNLSLVPDDYIRKQTLVNAERFITPELKEKEEDILHAQEHLYTLEGEIFRDVLASLIQQIEILQRISYNLAVLDVIISFAEVALRNNYSRPEITEDKVLSIKDGRHPTVEQVIPRNAFVPNDIELNHQVYFQLITGPNMSGKSTYMRQAALIVIMAQMGSFVPAKKAVVGIADRVFTRVGASDDIFSGQSTFMVEMREVAHICRNATSRSFIILDEIGRGTSTYDGISIARAVSEFLLKLRSRTLFATHYHELTDMANEHSGLRNYSIAVYDDGKDIVFLYKIISEATSRSYGIHVSKLAGVPDEIIEKAKEYLQLLERDGLVQYPEREQLQIIAKVDNESEVIKEIQNLDLANISPIQALNALYKWQNDLKGMNKDD